MESKIDLLSDFFFLQKLHLVAGEPKPSEEGPKVPGPEHKTVTWYGSLSFVPKWAIWFRLLERNMIGGTCQNLETSMQLKFAGQKDFLNKNSIA